LAALSRQEASAHPFDAGTRTRTDVTSLVASFFFAHLYPGKPPTAVLRTLAEV
jgi:hypothetical protein